MLPQAWLDRRARLAELSGDARAIINDLAKQCDVAETRAAVRAVAPERQPHGFYEALRWLDRLDYAVAHGIDEATAERRELYRVAAKRITERYSLLAVDAEIKPLARRRLAGTREMPPAVRRMRAWAAPGVLAAELARAATARGAQLRYATGRSTQTCHNCGHINTAWPANMRAELVLRCAECGKLWDQDENAARILCAAASAESAPAEVTLAAHENKGLRRARMTRKNSARKPAGNPLSAPPK